MLTQQSLDFLKDLSQNNNRDWYHANKDRFISTVKLPFENLVAALIENYKTVEPETDIQPKDAIYRIYRDTRFSKDKTPYKTHIGAIITPTGRKGKEYPGFYLHVEHGRLMLGGGTYFLSKESLYKVREHIMKHPKKFSKLVKNADFVKNFEEVKGDKNKRIPKEFRAFGEQQPLIYNKQFYFMMELDPQLILGEQGADFAAQYYKAGEKFNAFLKEAIV